MHDGEAQNSSMNRKALPNDLRKEDRSKLKRELEKGLASGVSKRTPAQIRATVRKTGDAGSNGREAKGSWDDLAGFIKNKGVHLTIEEINEAIAEAGAAAGMRGMNISGD